MHAVLTCTAEGAFLKYRGSYWQKSTCRAEIVQLPNVSFAVARFGSASNSNFRWLLKAAV